MSTSVPTRFPFAASGPTGDWRYALSQFAVMNSATAESIAGLAEGIAYLRGEHKRVYPAVNIGKIIYTGGSQKLGNCIRIYLDANTDSLDCTLRATPATADYTITVAESLGGNSTVLLLPGGKLTSPAILMQFRLAITAAGWSNISITGDAGAATHPTIVGFHAEGTKWRSY